MRSNVLDDDHRWINQLANGNCQPAETHQIGSQSEIIHQQEREQGDHRQNQGNRERRAQIAQKQNQKNYYQHRGFDQRMDNGLGCLVDQMTAIVENIHLDPLRQGRANFFQFLFDTLNHQPDIGATQTEHQPLDDLALTVLTHGPIARQGTEPDFGNVTHGDGNVITLGHHDIADVFQSSDAPLCAHQQGFLSLNQSPSPIITIIGLQRFCQGLHAYAARRQAGRIWDNFITAHLATEGIDIGHSRHGP